MNTNGLTENGNTISRGHAAITAGLALLLMAILAPIAYFGIIKTLVIPDDIAMTFSNIMANEGIFRVAVGLFLIVAILDIVVAWALYIYLKPINRSLSLLTAILRIVYAGILSVSLVFLVNVLQLLNGAAFLNAFDMNQLQAMVMLSIDSFDYGWDIGLIIFGFHLLVLGFLMFKAGFMKRILGILVIIASIGYLFDGFGKLLFAGFKYEIAIFTFVGEIAIIFWLILKGRKDAIKTS